MTEEEKQKILRERRDQVEKQFGTQVDFHEVISADRGRNPHISCYKCKAGCFHIEYENLMITCSENDFYQFSDVVIELRSALLAEKMQAEDEQFVLQGLM